MNDVRPLRATHCPFLDANDRRCAERFSLARLADVFEQCVGEYGRCPIYHQLNIRLAAPRGRDALALAG